LKIRRNNEAHEEAEILPFVLQGLHYFLLETPANLETLARARTLGEHKQACGMGVGADGS